MKKPKDFYMPTETLESALDACDLGDSHTAYVIQYPHRDDFDKITHVREVVEIDWGKVWKDLGKYMMDDSDKTYYFDKILELVEKQLAGEE